MKKSIKDTYLISALYFDDMSNITKDKYNHTWVTEGNPTIIENENSDNAKYFLQLNAGDSLIFSNTDANAIQLTDNKMKGPHFSMDFWMSCNSIDETNTTSYIKMNMNNSSLNDHNRFICFYRNKFQYNTVNDGTLTVNYPSSYHFDKLDRIMHVTFISFYDNSSVYYIVYLNESLLLNQGQSWYHSAAGDYYTISKPTIEMKNLSDAIPFHVGYFRLWKNYVFDIYKTTTGWNVLHNSNMIEKSTYNEIKFDNMVMM